MSDLILPSHLVNHEPNPIAVPTHPSDKVYSQEEQNEVAKKLKGQLEQVLGVELEGFVVIPMRADGVVQIIAHIPEDPLKTIRIARASATVTQKLLL